MADFNIYGSFSNSNDAEQSANSNKTDFSKYGTFVRTKRTFPLNEVDEKGNEIHREQKTSAENKSKKKKSKPSNSVYWDENPFGNVKGADKSAKQAEQSKGKKSKKRKSQIKVRFPIGLKLISIISAILGISLIGVTILVSYFVSKDTRLSAEENNLTMNARTASDCENRIMSALSATEAFSELLLSTDADSEVDNASLFFEHYPEIAAVFYPRSGRRYINRAFFVVHELEDSIVEFYAESEIEYIEMARRGNLRLKNASPIFQTPIISIFSPVNDSSGETSIIVFYSSESLFDSLSSGSINQSLFLNHSGEILVHSNLGAMMSATDFSDNPVYKKMVSGNSNNGQSYFNDDSGSEYIGAYKKIQNTGSAVITTVQLDIVLEGIRATTRRNIYLTVAILSIAILIIWFFSRSLSVPLRKLADVANEINNANFNTELFDELETKHHDEVSVLTDSTKNEREILNTITKLTNIGVVKSVIQKKVDFNPHLKDITIFFSDIRGFTKISDGFNTRFGKDSGAGIIAFLNDYMSRMVQCITITGGTVDKFEGDAIMACWGVLRNDDLSFEEMDDKNPLKQKLSAIHEKHKKKDALSAICATIGMRYALRKYNKDAEIFTKENEGKPNAQYKPEIKIGCGLNSGRATVGFMGSWEKMEFTSIGDPVNLASRTESSNKPCGTDILITEDTYNLLKMDYIKCPENNYTLKPENANYEIIVEKIPVAFEVKGKGKQHFYGVVNMPRFSVENFFRQSDPNFTADPDCLDVVGPNGPMTLSEMRIRLGIAEPNFEGVNLDEAENKIQVSAS